MTLRKRTPCVGICSTTYGDLVCRGCKRFAHEIVQWNGYDNEQQERVWQRLLELRDAVVAQHLRVVDNTLFNQGTTGEAQPSGARPAVMYAVLRQLVAEQGTLASVGLAPAAGLADSDTALAVMQAIDAEVYARSVAHYERNFKIPL